ncbi:plant phosphoribosyltransferase carboxy-terminal protein [Medicago truncatula]|uniref:Plant phosphoribosyltransferase carboxy-terminal protein n=1 Tax=Medicago truncatula TaxID=3880 RepID=G7JDB5_MEDTR|nr:plant phosphoribosyltransferase carboxy-terminal protein [Medicago truncatula]
MKDVHGSIDAYRVPKYGQEWTQLMSYRRFHVLGVKRIGELQLAARGLLHTHSMRTRKPNFFSLMLFFFGLITFGRWFNDVCHSKNHITSILVHILFLILFFIGLWNYRFCPPQSLYMETKLSWAEYVHPDELDKVFDTFPTSRSHDMVRMRYDRI